MLWIWNIIERVVDDLRQALSNDFQVSIAAVCFLIYVYEALKEELEKVDCVDFVFTWPIFIKLQMRITRY